MSTRASLTPRDLDSADHVTLVKTIKGLAMDGVQKANSGHPGMPMGAADMTATLWMRFLVHDPQQPNWPDRDRFVLSAGHGSMLLYSLLHLTGYDLSMDELKNFRQLGSKTPGHPEFGHTVGVEVTTGPLGTGFAAGVGMAMAERFLAARYNRDGHTIVDHFTYGVVSDGDLMEGVAAEAASIAGHQQLGKLVYLYDDNNITIDGSTELAFSENVGKRFEAYGWHVQHVDGHDAIAVAKALEAARAQTDRPSLIACKTTIGQGSPNKGGTAASHGAPLGPDEVELVKKGMDWPLEPFHVPADVLDRVRAITSKAAVQRKDWDERFAAYAKAHPQLAKEFETVMNDELPAGLFDALPTFEPGEKIATRKSGQKVLQALAAVHPTLLGGSADLTGSNGVAMPDAGNAQPQTPAGRAVHFGVREHGMAAICNGMAAHGGVRPFDATFLIFSDFMRGAIRLSALMKLPVVHVLSHDSILLGEDGPTHQPVEQCMALRTIPNLHVVRPADAKETAAAWKLALQRNRGDGPTAILVSRQGLPTLEGTRSDISEGGYVLWEPQGIGVDDLHGILVATGSEVPLALEAAKRLTAQSKNVRVVTMPCWEAFEAQTVEHRNAVLPPSVSRRLSVEAGTTLGWDRYARHHLGIDTFGESGPAADLAEHFGFTVDALVARYLDLA